MNPTCTTHIMRRFAHNNRVLYVNPFSADMPNHLSRGLGLRILRKLKGMVAKPAKPVTVEDMNRAIEAEGGRIQ